MRAVDPFSGLSEFAAVAETRSFTAAAARLGISPAAVSQTVKLLETRLGTPLFIRTTRRVGLTEAGAALYAGIAPATAEIAAALDAASALADAPAGLLRLTVPRMAVDLVVTRVMQAMRSTYPKVAIEVSVDDNAVELPGHAFDAGIRIGEYIERDMVAVRLTEDIQWSIVASPTYLDRSGRPETIEDLIDHDVIGYRFPASGSIYRWEFEREGRSLSVDTKGSVIVNDGTLLVSLAVAGLGLAYVADIAVKDEVASGVLIPVLTRFLPSSAGLHLYFPRHAQRQPKLRAFIDVAKQVLRSR
jgi:DNA-binding transcriptional LysR family regulator